MKLTIHNLDDNILYRAGIPDEYWSEVKKMARECSENGFIGYHEVIRAFCNLAIMGKYTNNSIKLKELLGLDV